MGQEKINYMKMARNLLEKSPSHGDIANNLVKLRKEIDDIYDVIKETNLYNYDKSRIESKKFLDDLKKQAKNSKELVEQSWLHFLDRSVKAPTSIHLRGVVILMIPTIKQCLDLYCDDQNKTNKTE